MRIVSVLMARKFINKGCIGYLAPLIEVGKEKLKLEDIPIVSEYTDMFLDELPGQLPEKDVDFSIELLPGTAPSLKLLII